MNAPKVAMSTTISLEAITPSRTVKCSAIFTRASPLTAE